MQAQTQTQNLHSHQTETETDSPPLKYSQSHKWEVGVAKRFSCSGNTKQIFILTLHRLQKWNSSFSAACRLMDSSESVNSLLNGASTCFTHADWACVCVCECVCLYAFPAVWAPLPQPNVPCLFLAHTPPSQMGEKWQKDEGGKGDGLEWGLLTMPVSQGTRSEVAAFLMHRQHPRCHMEGSRSTRWQVSGFKKMCVLIGHKVRKVN